MVKNSTKGIVNESKNYFWDAPCIKDIPWKEDGY